MSPGVPRRTPSLTRRLVAARGQILLGGAWCAAVVFCLVLAPLQPASSGVGAVAAVRRHELVAPESGRLVRLEVAQGAQVRQGDVVAVVEVPGLTELLAAAVAEVAATELAGEGDVADRTRRLARDLESARASLAQAEATLAADRARLEAARVELARVRAQGVMFSEEAVAVRAAEVTALQATVTGAERLVDTLRAGLSAATARAGAGAATGPWTSVATAERDAIEARIGALTLRAPVDGVVELVPPTVGTWVTGGIPVVTLLEPAAYEVVAYTSTAAASRLASGDSARVVSGAGQTLEGAIFAVGPAVGELPMELRPDPTIPAWGVPVTVRLQAPLRPGERVLVGF